ncbi:hypothetical protein [Mycolicibacterium sp. HS_4_1]
MTDHNAKQINATTFAEQARWAVEQLERSRQQQPAHLANARASAAEARTIGLTAEPWWELWSAMPTHRPGGEINGMLALPTPNAKELFGARLAFDLLGCCANEHEVHEVLMSCLRMVGDPNHMMLVCAAALKTIANHVVPQMLDDLEAHGSNYDVRVFLADAARNAWQPRVADVPLEHGADDPQVE